MEIENISYDKSNHTAVIIISRPKIMNAISSGLLSDLESVLDHIESDSDIRVVVITGGEKVFGAGAVLKEKCFNTLICIRYP
jgi:enoyl-CoA hydratase/carnithine racemase